MKHPFNLQKRDLCEKECKGLNNRLEAEVSKRIKEANERLIKCKVACSTKYPFSLYKRNLCKKECDMLFTQELVDIKKWKALKIQQILQNLKTELAPEVASTKETAIRGLRRVSGLYAKNKKGKKKSNDGFEMRSLPPDVAMTDLDENLLVSEDESFFDKNKTLIIGAGVVAAIFIGMRYMK